MLRAKTWTYGLLSAVLFGLGLVALPAAAQSGPGPAGSDERQVFLTDAPDEPPAEVYAAANRGLTLVFDGPLRNGGEVVVPGLDVDTHPFLAHALVLTPSELI